MALTMKRKNTQKMKSRDSSSSISKEKRKIELELRNFSETVATARFSMLFLGAGSVRLLGLTSCHNY